MEGVEGFFALGILKEAEAADDADGEAEEVDGGVALAAQEAAKSEFEVIERHV